MFNLTTTSAHDVWNNISTLPAVIMAEMVSNHHFALWSFPDRSLDGASRNSAASLNFGKKIKILDSFE